MFVAVCVCAHVHTCIRTTMLCNGLSSKTFPSHVYGDIITNYFDMWDKSGRHTDCTIRLHTFTQIFIKSITYSSITDL